jgi:hypothetical protein
MRAVLWLSLFASACTVPDVTFFSDNVKGDAGCGATVWYADVDGDGHGDPAAGTSACSQPAMTVANNDDCDDRNAQRYPGAAEACDALDNDCDANTAEPCPAGCQAHKRPGFDSQTYLLCSPKVPWNMARMNCTAAGFHLVRIDDAGENLWLRSTATSVMGPDPYLIGANDLGAEGVWRWDITGDQFWQGASNGTVVAGRYSNWLMGEPNNAGNIEDCAEIGGDGTWNDQDCLARSFVCERP